MKVLTKRMLCTLIASVCIRLLLLTFLLWQIVIAFAGTQIGTDQEVDPDATTSVENVSGVEAAVQEETDQGNNKFNM